MPIQNSGEVLETLDSKNKQLSAEIENLKKLNTEKDEFIDFAGKELINPISAINSYLSLLLLGKMGGLNDQQKRCLEIASIECNRLAGMISDILDVSKMGAKELALELQETHIADLMQLSINSLNQKANEKNIRLALELSGDPPLVYADNEKIPQVMNILLNNAIKFSYENSSIIIKASNFKGQRSEDFSDYIKVDIIDSGKGIQKEEINNLFDKIYWIKNKLSSKECKGISLLIAKEIIEAHKGRIWAESESNKGAVFSFILPVRQ